MSRETVLLTPIPECDDLFCIDCKITTLNVTDKTIPSIFHYQILICRSLLSLFPDVIAAPVPQTDNYVCIIAKKDYFQLDKMLQFLKMKKLWFSDPQPVNYEIYKECVKYTMFYKLAPSWNKFGIYLNQGMDFLTSPKDPNAVKFDVNVKKQGMTIKFTPTNLKVHPLKVEELGLSPSLVAEFKYNPEGIIHLGRHWANVLPSFIKAKLLKVLKQIPKACCFGNYQLLCRHWKNMYGYILPENSEGILYYEVCFPSFPEQIFVYPSICLQLEYPKMVHCKNQGYISIHFVEGLTNKVRSICGKPLALVKIDLKEIEEPSNRGFCPAKETKFDKNRSQIPKMPSIYGTVSSQPKLKQQTLNFSVVKVELPSPLQNSNSANSSQTGSSVSKIKSLEFPSSILSYSSQSTPLKRKLIVDPKVENDNISVESETLQTLMNLVKSNETPVRKENEKKRVLLDALLQEKSDIRLPKDFSPPTKRVRIFGSNTVRPSSDCETVTKYFKQHKLNVTQHKVKPQGKLQLQNLLTNK